MKKKEDRLSRLKRRLFEFSVAVTGLHAETRNEGMDNPLWERVVIVVADAGAVLEKEPFSEPPMGFIDCVDQAGRSMVEAHYLLRILDRIGCLPKEEAKLLIKVSGSLMKELIKGSKALHDMCDE